MGQELEPYTEVRRDKLEDELAAAANKRELSYRYSNGIKVIAYWMVLENITTIYLEDERNNAACEFSVPPDEVMEWFWHPYAHIDAEMPIYRQGSNNE